MNGANMVDTRGLFVSFRNLRTQIASRTTFTLTASSVSQQTTFISLRRSQRIYVQQAIASASVRSFLTQLGGAWTGINTPSLSRHRFNLYVRKGYFIQSIFAVQLYESAMI